jgi:tetrahydromethanopterin S-methyltransferase subunit C
MTELKGCLSLLSVHLHTPVFSVVQVFGAVSKGMDIVKKIEGYGSGSGKTSKAIVIAVSTPDIFAAQSLVLGLFTVGVKIESWSIHSFFLEIYNN